MLKLFNKNDISK